MHACSAQAGEGEGRARGVRRDEAAAVHGDGQAQRVGRLARQHLARPLGAGVPASRVFKGFWGSGFAAGREYPVTGPHRVGTHRLHQPMGAPQPRQYRRLPCCEENLHAPWGKALWMAVLCGCLKTSPRGAHRCPVGPVEGKQIK